ncbi:MAG: 1-deoxy-D-xylulose-5-phosphate reductoisomerase [bacterium]
MRSVAILGSTGSIGRSTLEVIAAAPDQLRVEGLAAGRNLDLLVEQAKRFLPRLVAVADKGAVAAVQAALPRSVAVVGGPAGLEDVATLPGAELVVMAVVGIAGLLPTLAAAGAGKRIALATKEVLVAGGTLVTDAVAAGGASLIPLDSEHNAIFQCLTGEDPDAVARLILTASGGPFLRRSPHELARVSPQEALAHPIWRMGPRVTIDSATMMNKGLEIIEAAHLFRVAPAAVDVVVHPQAVVHAFVEFVDGVVKTLVAPPDMRLVVHYALHYPHRQPAGFLPGGSERGSIFGDRLSPLTFEPPDLDRFPSLGLAREAAAAGGTMPAVLNAADEVAVERFLDGSIAFLAIPRIVRNVMDAHAVVRRPDLEDILEADTWARAEGERLIAKRGVRSASG